MATAKNAGAGRGFVNPRRTDESEADYVSPSDRAAMEKQLAEARAQAEADAGYKAATEGHKAGGFIHHSMHYKKHAAGHKEHQEHVKAMCGGGYMKGKK